MNFLKIMLKNNQFVYLSTIIDTSSVPLKLKPYIPLLLEMSLESPVLEGETEIPYEEVVARLAEETISHSFSIGVGGARFMPGAYSESVMLFMQCEPDKYEQAVSWMRKLLYQTRLTAERAKVLATKMENSVSELKRSGSKVVKIMMDAVLFNEESNIQASNMIRQQQFLKNIVKKLDCSPKEILSDLEELRYHLTTPSNMMLHMATDLALLSNPMEPWQRFLPPVI